MAAANLVVKLLLENDGFDKNIRTAKASIEGFEKVGKNVTAVLGKFAAGIGLVSGAVEVFERIMKGSQKTSDTWDAAIRAGKNSVDSFFTAISTGDFTAFNQGLDNIIKKAKEAAGAIDQLGNTTMSYGYFTSKYNAEFQTALQKAKDKTLSQSDRETAKETAIALIGKQEEITSTLVATVEDAVKSLVTETNALSKEDLSLIDIDDILFIDVAKNRSDLKEQLTAQYAEYEKIYNEVVGRNTKSVWVQTSAGGYYQNNVDYEAIKKEMQQYNQQYKQAVLYNEILNKKGDEWLKTLIQTVQQADNATRALATMKQAMNEVHSMDLSQGITATTSATKAKEAPAVEGSLRWINEEIAKVQKELQNLNPELNPQKLQELQNKLADLENKKRKIEFEVTYIDKGEKHDSVASGKTELQTDGWLALQKLELKPNTNNIDEQVDATEKWEKSLKGVQEAMKGVADTLMITSNMTKEGASAWLTYSANIAMAVTTALPYLIALFNQKARNAIVEQFSTPFGGIFAGIAAATAVAAAIAAIPKTFANGGIVDSPFGVGDRVLARVNGGEMILNKHQQGNLFNLLDNGGLSGINNKVTFEIEGKKLIGVLKNYNNKINKAL